MDIKPWHIGVAAALVVTVFSAGFATHWGLAQIIEESKEARVARLWKQVESYQSYMRDPKNLGWEPTVQAAYRTPPYDLDPILAQLVSDGELDHFDLVLPTVPAEQGYWMDFCDRHPEFIEASGNTQYVVFRPKGKQPINLDLWVRKGSEDLVRQLVHELEALAEADAENDVKPLKE
jgi:hypothetical protein